MLHIELNFGAFNRCFTVSLLKGHSAVQSALGLLINDEE